jgi:formylglycine-generating enzyme required for sulfatase activity
MATRKGKRVAIAAGAVALGVLAVVVIVGWPHLVFWYRFEPLGKNAQGYREYRHRRTGIVMVFLPGGKFLMGAQKTDPNGPNYDPEAKDDEDPVHQANLSSFLIGKCEVTQGQWRTVMGERPIRFAGDDLPSENDSWDEVQEFQKRTSLSLPSEAQWEYACRAAMSASPEVSDLDHSAWYESNSGKRSHPVGQKAPNGCGLHDMLGNVSEWCDDI